MTFSHRVVLACLTYLCLAPLAQADTTPVQNNDPQPYRYSFGIGYPDLRARAQVWGPMDVELKYAFGDGVQAYSGRLYYRAVPLQKLNLTLGAEGGALSFSGVESLSGTGSFFGGFAGAEYDLAKRLSLSADFGPQMVTVNSGGSSVGGLEWVISTALYFRVF